MKLATLLIALLAGTAQAELVFHQSVPDPRTSHITTWVYHSEQVMLSQNIALANVISGDANIITFVKNCKRGTTGGEVEQFSNGEQARDIWLVGGKRLVDITASRICAHGLINTARKS